MLLVFSSCDTSEELGPFLLVNVLSQCGEVSKGGSAELEELGMITEFTNSEHIVQSRENQLKSKNQLCEIVRE